MSRRCCRCGHYRPNGEFDGRGPCGPCRRGEAPPEMAFPERLRTAEAELDWIQATLQERRAVEKAAEYRLGYMLHPGGYEAGIHVVPTSPLPPVEEIGGTRWHQLAAAALVRAEEMYREGRRPGLPPKRAVPAPTARRRRRKSGAAS